MVFNNKQADRKYNNTWNLNTDMSKIAFMSIIALNSPQLLIPSVDMISSSTGNLNNNVIGVRSLYQIPQ
jgi:hypothetical protein